jgi:hypothetical protein
MIRIRLLHERKDDENERPTLARRAMDAIWEVMAFGAYPSAEEWETILASMQPFLGYQYLSGAPSRDSSDRVLSLVWGVVGDAHRELGRPEMAAEAYRTAVDFRPGLQIADLYVPLVLKHRFADHYEQALRSLVEGKRIRSRPGIQLRLVAEIWSFCVSPRYYAVTWKDRALRSYRRRTLERRILEGASDCNIS